MPVPDNAPTAEQDRQSLEAVAATGPRYLKDDEVALVRRVIARREAQESTWTRRQWDEELDRQFDGSDPVFHLRCELARMPFSAAAYDQLHDALLALPSYRLLPSPEVEPDEDDDTILPAPTLVERLAYLFDLGKGKGAPPTSVRRAGIIRAAMEAVTNAMEAVTNNEQIPATVAGADERSACGGPGITKPPAKPEWKTHIDRLYELLDEAQRTGKSECLFKGLLGMVTDGQFSSFMGEVKKAIKGGLYVDTNALRKARRERQDADRLANAKDNLANTVHTGAAPTLITCATWEIAGIITSASHFAVDAGRRLHVYADGVYVPQGDAHIKRRAKQILNDSKKPEAWYKKRVEEVSEYVTVDAPTLWDRPPLDVVNALNGLVDVKARKLMAHSPEHLSPIQVPVNFEPDARCPRWDNFVATTFPPDAEAIAWEIPAWIMTPDTSIQKAILLTGDGANGKSTYLAAVLAFLGRRNASAVSLQKLEADRFSVSRLVGKLANVCPDLPSTDLMSTSVFKTITGGDAMLAERKFEGSFEFIPYARLLFSANHPPRSQDASPAFFRRWVVVPFDRTFTEGVKGTIPRGELDAALADPGELRGVMNKALEALDRLRKYGFTESPTMRHAMNEFRQTTDPFAVWLDRYTVTRCAATTPCDRILREFNQECESRGRPTITRTALGRAVAHLRPTVTRLQRTVNGEQAWCYIGLGLLTTGRD